MTSNCCGFFHLGICVTYGLPCDPTGIDNEWRKTQCMPREVCIDVGKEFGAATNTFFKPPCVSVYRCGGCCNSEGQQCMNTSTSYLSKTVGVRLRQAPGLASPLLPPRELSAGTSWGPVAGTPPSNAGGPGSIPGPGAKTLHALQPKN